MKSLSDLMEKILPPNDRAHREDFSNKNIIDSLTEKELAKSHKTTVQTVGSETFFQSGSIRVGIHASTKGGGTTLHINYAGQLYKIRVIP